MSDFLDPGLPTASLNNNAPMLDDIPLDTAPVTLSPFTGEHFNLWKFQIQCIFRSRDLLAIAEGNELYAPNADSCIRRYWKRRDQQAMDILVQTMDRTLIRPLLGATSAHQMWSNLQLHYDKRAISTVHSLQKRFFDIKPVAVKGIRLFLSELSDLNSQLRDMDVSKFFDEDAVISKVISSLPPDYNAFTTAWELTSPSDKTLTNLSTGLVKEEAKLKTAATPSIDVTTAFYSHSKPSGSHRPNSSGSTTSSGAHNCSGTSCLHQMHKPPPTPTGLTPRFSPTAAPVALTPEQRQARQQYYNTLKKTTACHNCGQPGHWKGECPDLTEVEREELRRNCRSSPRPPPLNSPSRSFPAVELSPALPAPDTTHTGFMAVEQFQPLTDFSSLHFPTEPVSNSSTWYADSAASSHMTRHCHWFTSYSAFPKQYWPVQGIAPLPIYAAGIGTIVIERLIDGRWLQGSLEMCFTFPTWKTTSSLSRKLLKRIFLLLSHLVVVP